MDESERDLMITMAMDNLDLAHTKVELMELHMPQVDWDTGTPYCAQCGPGYPCATAIALGVPINEEPA